MSKLKNIIIDLIESKKEDTFYDFKEQWHEKKVDLLHDIICLANCKNEGNRYLIFGIKDKTFEVVGITTEDKNRKNQQQLIDFLRTKNFSGGLYPSILVDTIKIENKDIDVITIEDESEKPYFLTEDFKEDKKCMGRGAIYTRIKDTNTPINKTAERSELEYMWKENFGLIKSPYDKFKIYLQDIDNWEEVKTLHEKENENKPYEKQWFYRPDPVFKLSYSKNKDTMQHWYLACLRAVTKYYGVYEEKADKGEMPTTLVNFKYYETIIYQFLEVNMYEEGLSFANPNFDNYIDYYIEDERVPLEFLYYDLTSIEPYFTYFSMKKEINRIPQTDSITDFKTFINEEKILYQTRGDLGTRYKYLPLIFFKNKDEKDEFLEYLKPKINTEFKKYRENTKNYELLIDYDNKYYKYEKRDILSAIFAYWSYNMYWDKKRKKFKTLADIGL